MSSNKNPFSKNFNLQTDTDKVSVPEVLLVTPIIKDTSNSLLKENPASLTIKENINQSLVSELENKSPFTGAAPFILSGSNNTTPKNPNTISPFSFTNSSYGEIKKSPAPDNNPQSYSPTPSFNISEIPNYFNNSTITEPQRPTFNPFDPPLKNSEVDLINIGLPSTKNSATFYLRTEKSDIDSIIKTGGASPEPQVITPEEFGSSFFQSQSPPKNSTNPKDIDSFSAIFKPNTTPTTTNHKEQLELVPSQKKNNLLIIITITILLLIIISGGAFILYKTIPNLISKNNTVKSEIKENTVVPEKIIENNELNVPQATLPEQKQNTEVQAEVVKKEEVNNLNLHYSAFNFPIESLKDSFLKISKYSVIDILAGLQNKINPNKKDGDIEEIVVVTDSGQAESALFITALLPEIKNTPLEKIFTQKINKDFTAFLYYEKDVAWPGFIFKKSSSTTPMINIKDLAKIESSSIKNLFLTVPKGESSTWRSSPVKNKYASRYTPFLSDKPASVNYGVFGDYIIITTTFQSLLKSTDLLKL